MAYDIRTTLVDFAPAKVNLTLRIGQRRPDGYHDIESLVVFADIGDDLRLRTSESLALSVEGETAARSGAVEDNLVLKAARALMADIPDLRAGHFELEKRLPVAAGLGGGSSDAAAALRLLALANPEKNLSGDPRLMSAARQTGADVPVCVQPRPRIMRGAGEILSAPLCLPKLPAILVNPGVSVPTAAVFSARARMPGATAFHGDDPISAIEERASATSGQLSAVELIDALRQSGNDLEAPAMSLHPVIGDVLAALRALPGCKLARMSGSGATCFGLFGATDVGRAAGTLAAQHPGWWIAATTLG